MEGGVSRISASPRPCNGRRVVAKKRPRAGGFEGFVHSVKKLQRREISSKGDRAFTMCNAQERFRNIRLQEEYDTYDPKGHCSMVLPFLRKRSKIIEIVAAHDVVFALAQSGVCAAFNRETNQRICFMNVSPDEVIRSLFYNKNNDSLITVSVYALDNFSSLKCRSTRIEYIRWGKPDAGFALFESESLKWPGFVEFDDVNGKVLTYSAQDSIYKVFDLKNYTMLYSISDKHVQEIKISPGTKYCIPSDLLHLHLLLLLLLLLLLFYQVLYTMLEDSKDASISQVLGSSGSGDGLLNNNNNVNSAKTHQVVVSESNNNIIGGSNSISGGDEEDRVGIIDNPLAKFEEGDRSFGGNRWPRQETLALLQIRSDMDVAFRDASVKAPLWDVVSRKLAELGYNRSSKKCKEKFENVYKYHKRTKEGRSGKSDGKTYRFFDQLKALENHAHHPPPHIQTSSTTMVVTSMNNNNPPLTVSHQNTTVPSVSHHQQPNTINLTFPSFQTPSNPTILPPPLSFQPSITATEATANINTNTSAFQSISTDNLFSNSTSSSTSSDEEVLERNMRRNKKRKWKDFFERLMVEVIQKQEELQNKFLEAIEKREHERMVREEAWRMQELSRINREREILSQERSMAAAKDSAVMAFLQKFSEKQNQNQNIQNIIPQPSVQPPASLPMPKLAPTSVTQPSPLPQLQQMIQPRQNVEITTPTTRQAAADNNGEENELMRASSSRWPKVEIEALIKLRSTLDSKYQENSPKGPLWEEISGSMKELGYNRNAKRCKEKWENINKYYKKVKESNKKRPEDSKTCPYFSQLEALYKEKNKFENTQMNQIMKPEINSIPMMVRPEQQWPPQQENKNNEEDDPMDQNHEDGDEDEDEDDDESDGNYEFVANKPANSNNSIAVGSATAV